MKSVLEIFFSLHLPVSTRRSSLSALGGRRQRRDAKGRGDQAPFERSRGCPFTHKAGLSLLLIVNSHLPTSRHHFPKRGTASPAGDAAPMVTHLQAHKLRDAPAPQEPSTGILRPKVLISQSFSCVSQRRKLKLTVSQGKTCRNLHFRFGATAKTRLLTRVSAHASGKPFSLFIPWLPCLQKQGQRNFSSPPSVLRSTRNNHYARAIPPRFSNKCFHPVPRVSSHHVILGEFLFFS